VEEIEHHTRLCRLAKDHIVGIRGASMRGNGGLVRDMQRRYTLFIEYTDGGNLADLIEYWRNEAKRHVPEVFVWLLLKCLVNACIAVEKIGRVHHDIKVCSHVVEIR
jgi:hypothetical protein